MPVHVEFAKAEQILFLYIVKEISFTFFSHDEERAAKWCKDKEVEQEECSDILGDLHEHVHKEASLAEDAQEVEQFDPHEETGHSLHCNAVFGDAWPVSGEPIK